jgi:hypothetical protein
MDAALTSYITHQISGEGQTGRGKVTELSIKYAVKLKKKIKLMNDERILEKRRIIINRVMLY